MKKNSVEMLKINRKYKLVCLFAFLALFVCGFVLGAVYDDIFVKFSNINESLQENTIGCSIIEKNLEDKIFPPEEPNFVAHAYNSYLYDVLSENACPENKEKYKNLSVSEKKLVDVLKGTADIKQYEIETIIQNYIINQALKDKNNFINGYLM